MGREEAVQKFIDQHNIVYPTLISDAVEMDTFLYKTARESFIGTPTLLVFNPKGELVAVQPGTVTPTELSNFIRSMTSQSIPKTLKLNMLKNTAGCKRKYAWQTCCHACSSGRVSASKIGGVACASSTHSRNKGRAIDINR